VIETLYPLEAKKTSPVIDYEDSKHKYWIDGIEVPSATTILEGCTAKDALPWWGMRVGLAAALKLFQDGIISWPALQTEDYAETLSGVPSKTRAIMRGRGAARKPKTLLEYHALEQRLTTNHIRDDAGDRGTAVHTAVEQLGIEDVIPNIDEFPVEQRGYIRAIARWWMNQEPEFHRQEIIVGSREHAYAGRFDLDATMKGYGRCLIDFKTSKGVYESHFEQLRLYQVAEAELMKFLKAKDRVKYDHLCVVHLMPTGEFQIHLGDHVSPDTALHAIHLHHSRVADKARKKAKEAA
jgi:hypothetical protein